MAQRKKVTSDTVALEQRLTNLEADMAKLKKTVDKKQSRRPRKSPWRGPASWLCVALAATLLFAGNLAFWIGNTIVDTDRYVAAVGPLIQKPEIQTALAQYTTTQLFSRVDVEGYVQEALPPRAEFLAPQLTTQLKTQTQNSVKSLLSSQKVQDYWYSSIERRHDAIISFSQSYEGDGTIEISDIFSQLSKRLDGTKLGFLSDKQLPDSVGSIKVATVGWLPVLHKVSTNIGLYQAVTTLLLIGFSVAAVMLSTKRRRMVITLGFVFAVTMLATLLATRITGSVAASQVAQTYQSAVQVAYNTIMHSFVTQTVTLLLISILMVLVAWLSGPYKSANLAKARINAFLAGRLHQSIFSKGENGFTLWLGKYKRHVQWICILLIAIVMLLVQLSPKLIVAYGLLMLVSALVVELLAANKPSK
ncbi:MAG: hypothetical protein AAB436_02960 [Patescibacteria group bacterium]